MKIKRWLIISYIIVMLSPVVSGLTLFNWIKGYNKEIQVTDYLDNMNKFKEYESILENPKLYSKYNQKYKLVKENEEDYIKVRLYDRYGFNLYSSVPNDILFTINKENLYKGLYEIKHGHKYDSIKKPVYKDNEIVGIYEMTVVRTEWIEGVNRRSFIALGLFISNFIVVLIIVIKMINKKINKPLNLLINSMGSFARGENINIGYNSKDEIGELINHFNSMKSDIEEKNLEIRNQQKSKEYMIAAISHDLKTPLTSIRAYTELIETENDSYKDIILGKCDYMSNMLEDLLTYTLLTSDYNMDFVEVEGQEFFEMLISGYEEICEIEGLEYKSLVKVNSMYRVDVKQMVRVVDNLVSNAIRYSSEGGQIFAGAFSSDITLPWWIDKTYKDELEDFRKDRVIIIVKNNGEEISKENIENILEPFYKTDSSRKKVKKSGTGLGLSIVKLILEKHSGEVKVLSDKDKGTVIACVIDKMEG